MTKPSQEQAANLLDQLQLDDDIFNEEEPLEPIATIAQAPKPQTQALTLADDDAATPEIKQDTHTQPHDTVEVVQPVKINGFSMLLDHLKAEAIKHEQSRQKRHQDTQRFAA